ncbi:hypothetical protein ACFQX6_67105 [Streptosporangium lutulentum]
MIGLEDLADKDSAATIVTLEKRIRGLESWRDGRLDDAARCTQEAERSQSQLGQPFPHARRLIEVTARNEEIDRLLGELALEDASNDLNPGRIAEFLGSDLPGNNYQHHPDLEQVDFTIGTAPSATPVQVRLSEDPNRPFLLVVRGQACAVNRKEMPDVLRFLSHPGFRRAMPKKAAKAIEERLIDDPGPRLIPAPPRLLNPAEATLSAAVRTQLEQLAAQHTVTLTTQELGWLQALPIAAAMTPPCGRPRWPTRSTASPRYSTTGCSSRSWPTRALTPSPGR